ncbi:MAG TPA: cytochrome P450 [Cellvibrio sp.]|nr:cytochrome P450 [Cellvibrio sp.]
MSLLLVNAQQGLNSLVQQLWGLAQRHHPKSAFPLRVIDDPESVRAILNDANTFRKNYQFLDSFSQGRFTDNGTHWSTRVHLTQPQYSKNHFLKHSEAVQQIYSSAFNQLHETSSLEDIGDAVVSAAVKIVSQVFGLDESIPWSSHWANRVRDALVQRQWIGFSGTTPAQLYLLDRELQDLRRECASAWKNIPQLQSLLEHFSAQAESIPGFDPTQELIQNIIASSETTAASIMWAATILGCMPDIQNDLRTQKLSLDNFIQELLRMYPPVPFVTRQVEQNTLAGRESFAAGEAFIVSIFGLHYSDFWVDSFVFKPERFAQEQEHLRDHYMPFLIGSRTCGGRKLAEMELRVAVAVLLDKFTVSVPNPAGVSSLYGLSFRPKVDEFILTRR